MEIKINKNKRKELFSFLYELSFKFNGQTKEEKDKIEISFDLIHRFFKGKVVCNFNLEEKGDLIEIKVDTKNSEISLNNAGKGLLILGVISIIPWIFWWYMPTLLPFVSISGIFLILTYLGIGRKPPYIYPNYYVNLITEYFNLKKYN